MHSFNMHHDDLTADDMDAMHDKATEEALMDLEKPILNITVNESGVGGSADQYFID